MVAGHVGVSHLFAADLCDFMNAQCSASLAGCFFVDSVQHFWSQHQASHASSMSPSSPVHFRWSARLQLKQGGHALALAQGEVGVFWAVGEACASMTPHCRPLLKGPGPLAKIHLNRLMIEVEGCAMVCCGMGAHRCASWTSMHAQTWWGRLCCGCERQSRLHSPGLNEGVHGGSAAG